MSHADAFPALKFGTWADALEIHASDPGIDPSSIQVTVEKSLLVLSGERRLSQGDAQEGVISYARERFDGPFRRVATPPAEGEAHANANDQLGHASLVSVYAEIKANN